MRRALRQDCRVAPGSHVMVAVSGGPDSVALLLALERLSRTYPLRLSAAHLHHGLRGRAADADQAAVRRRCRALRVPMATARWDARARMKRRGLAGQAGLCTLRREFLLLAAGRRGADFIATGHTANDQLETMLLRLARGAGLHGLAGIAPRAGKFVRPLLGLARGDVLRFLKAAGAAYREDRSNRSLTYARNRVRARVIPELARAQGQTRPETLPRAAARAAGELRRSARLLRSRARRAFAKCSHQKGSVIRVDCDKVRTYAWPIRRELLRFAWSRTGARRGLTLRHLEALEGLLGAAETGAAIDLPAGRLARRGRGYLELRPRSTRGPGA